MATLWFLCKCWLVLDLISIPIVAYFMYHAADGDGQPWAD